MHKKAIFIYTKALTIIFISKKSKKGEIMKKIILVLVLSMVLLLGCQQNSNTTGKAVSTGSSNLPAILIYGMYNSAIKDSTLVPSSQVNAMKSRGYVDRGIQGYIFNQSEFNTFPLYKLWHQNLGDFAFTINESERQLAQSKNYQYQGILGYVYNSPVLNMYNVPIAIPLYKLWNQTYGDFLYTTNQNDIIAAHRLGYEDRGIAGYILPPCKDDDGSMTLEESYYNKSSTSFTIAFPREQYPLDLVTYTDSCSGQSVMEFFCDWASPSTIVDGYAVHYNFGRKFFTCPNGCSNGACIRSAQPICSDSDVTLECPDGKNYYVKGNTSGIDWGTSNYVVKEDYCITSGPKAGLLAEYFCQQGQVASISYRCSSNCSNGACITSSRTGSAYITSTPSGASISYGGLNRGVTPKNFTSLNPGSYTFTLNKTGYYIYTASATVYAGQTTNINAILIANSCTPKTCAQLGKNCGSWPDQCGGTLNCGTCSAGQSCDAGVCKRDCADGTKHNQCSTKKPMFCNDGTLNYNCPSCGCPLPSQYCIGGGHCSASCGYLLVNTPISTECRNSNYAWVNCSKTTTGVLIGEPCTTNLNGGNLCYASQYFYPESIKQFCPNRCILAQGCQS